MGGIGAQRGRRKKEQFHDCRFLGLVVVVLGGGFVDVDSMLRVVWPFFENLKNLCFILRLFLLRFQMFDECFRPFGIF